MLLLLAGGGGGVIGERSIFRQTAGRIVSVVGVNHECTRSARFLPEDAARRRLRLGALLRGAAALVAVALTATLVLVLITNASASPTSSLFAARVALVLALAAVVGYGVALPWRALNDRRAARKAEAAFPQFDQRLVTFAERDRGGRDPFLELLAADTLQVAKAAQPAYLVPNGKASGLDCQRREHRSACWCG